MNWETLSVVCTNCLLAMSLPYTSVYIPVNKYSYLQRYTIQVLANFVMVVSPAG